MEARGWGAGKVVEVTAGRATIQFSDGIIRKIASTHYIVLEPADPASYLPPPERVLPVKIVRAAPKREKAVKTAS
jgi:hypothetical protein